MFRELRKKEKQMNEEEMLAILNEGDYGIICLNTKEGYPYGVPVNYVYDQGKIYFHGGNKGLKYESVMENEKASFTIVLNIKYYLINIQHPLKA